MTEDSDGLPFLQRRVQASGEIAQVEAAEVGSADSDVAGQFRFPDPRMVEEWCTRQRVVIDPVIRGVGSAEITEIDTMDLMVGHPPPEQFQALAPIQIRIDEVFRTVSCAPDAPVEKRKAIRVDRGEFRNLNQTQACQRNTAPTNSRASRG